jgi:flagellar FliL protein
MSEAAKTESGGSGGGKMVMILTAVNLLATFGIVGLLFVSFQKEKSQTSVSDIQVAEHAEAEEHGGGHGEKADAHGGGHGEKAEEHGGGHGAKSDDKNAEAFNKMVTLDQFTVNLATPGTTRPKFVRVNISLEVPTPDAESEVMQKMPQVRNAIIDLFNSKRASDLATAEGRDYIKEEIRSALNGFMHTGKVKGVFFTNFAVSS